MKMFFLTGMFLILTMFFCACGHQNDLSADPAKDALIIEDDVGNKVVLLKKPERIVVTSASFLEPLHAVGGNIVGCPQSKNKTPSWAKNISTIGQVYQIDIERLLACKPDLIIINKGMNEKILAVAQENNISALVMNMKTYEEVKRSLKIFSEINYTPEIGEKLIKSMDDQIQQILREVPKTKKRVAIIHSTTQGLSLQLEESIAGNIVKILNWENIASDIATIKSDSNSVEYSMEILVEQNPEIIFVTSMGNFEDIECRFQELINSNKSLQTLNAVKKNRIYYLPQDLFLLSPGLDYPKAVKFMVQLVYPQIFQ